MGIMFAALGVGLILLGITLGGELRLFIDLPSIAIVSGLTVFLTFAYHQAGKSLNAFLTAFGSGQLSPSEAQEKIRILWTARGLASASGVVGCLIGFVNMLANLDDPKSIGPAMAVSLLTLLYAVLISEVLLGPLINRVRNRIDGDSIVEEPTKVTVVTIVAAPLAVLAFFVLILALQP